MALPKLARCVGVSRQLIAGEEAGGEKLVERELGQALLEPQLPVIDDLVAQVTAHRATLSA